MWIRWLRARRRSSGISRKHRCCAPTVGPAASVTSIRGRKQNVIASSLFTVPWENVCVYFEFLCNLRNGILCPSAPAGVHYEDKTAVGRLWKRRELTHLCCCGANLGHSATTETLSWHKMIPNKVICFECCLNFFLYLAHPVHLFPSLSACVMVLLCMSCSNISASFSFTRHIVLWIRPQN